MAVRDGSSAGLGAFTSNGVKRVNAFRALLSRPVVTVGGYIKFDLLT